MAFLFERVVKFHVFEFLFERIGDWRLEIRDRKLVEIWRILVEKLEIGDWRLEIENWRILIDIGREKAGWIRLTQRARRNAQGSWRLKIRAKAVHFTSDTGAPTGVAGRIQSLRAFRRARVEA